MRIQESCTQLQWEIKTKLPCGYKPEGPPWDARSRQMSALRNALLQPSHGRTPQPPTCSHQKTTHTVTPSLLHDPVHAATRHRHARAHTHAVLQRLKHWDHRSQGTNAEPPVLTRAVTHPDSEGRRLSLSSRDFAAAPNAHRRHLCF